MKRSAPIQHDWYAIAQQLHFQIFDLLESIPTTNSKEQPKKPTTRPSSSAVRTSSAMQRSFSQAFGSFGNRMSMAAAANGGNGIIKRQALALKNDLDGGKYVAGLKEIRVKTREEAHAIFKLGQIDRQVFGTGQNQQSSRSHGIFTVKIVKIHNGAPNVGNLMASDGALPS
jgi:kinesin family protein 20